MNVVFLEPAFPANQRAFVLALAEVGATVIGIGERPADWLDDELKGAMAHYHQVHSVVDEGALLDAVRQIQGAVWVDRLEATIEAHIMAAAHVREACTIPGTSSRTAFLCRDKPAMKEVLRAAGVACAASTGASSAAEVEEFVAAVGFPVILKPRDAAGASGTHRADDAEQLAAAIRATGVDRGAGIAVEEFIEGHEGFYDTISIDGHVVHEFVSHYFPNVLDAMRHRLDLTAVHRHQPSRRGRRVRRGQSARPHGQRGARHRHVGDAHGVVLRPQGIEVLRDRLPAAGRAGVGPVRRRQ